MGRRLLSGFLTLLVCSGAQAQGPTEILPNGSFEEADGPLPAGWVRVEGTAQSVLYSDDRPRTGARCIKLVSTGEAGLLRTSRPLPVEPGVTYRLRQYYRIEESNLEGGQAMYVRARLLGDDGRRLDPREHPPASAHTGGYARVSEGWRMREVDFTVPGPARTIEVDIYPAPGFQGVVAVDDVQILRLPRRIFSPPPGSLAFDFVVEDTEPAPGFTAVPFDRSFEEAGALGWKIRPGTALHASLRAVQPGYPTQLHSHSARRATFSCALPDGEYVCSVFMGAIWRTNIDEMNHVVEVNGERVVSEEREFNELMDEEYFRYVHATLVTPDDLERKGLAVYDRYIRPRYRRHDFTVTVTGGRMDVEPISGYMSAIIITPAAQAEAHAKAVAELDAQLAEEFASNWAELLPTDPSRGASRGDYEPTAQDRRRGYVVFRRHWMQAVEHDSRPDPEDVGTELTLFATPGEYEPVTLSIWPLQDLHNVKVTPSGLRAADGTVLPADVIQVWYLQQKHERRARPCTAYYLRGSFLPDWEVRELFGGITQRCWLSLKLPEQAAPGVYRGEVKFAPENAPPTTLELSLRVLPFQLRRPERLHVMRRAANSVVIPYPSEYPVRKPASAGENDIRNKQFYRRAAIEDLYEHGFGPEFSIWWRTVFSREKGVTEWDQANALSGPPRQFLQLIEDSPFGRQDLLLVDGAPIAERVLLSFGAGTDEWSVEDTRNWLKDLSTTLREKGFDKVYMHITAEESHTLPKQAGTEAWIRYHRFITENRDEWPNLFTCHTCNTAWGQPIALREADLAFLGMFHGVGDNGQEQVEMARSTGKPFGLYGCRGRIVPGYYLWEAGAYGTFHEFYGPYWGIPDNDWDNPLGMDSNARQVMNEAPGWCNVTYSPTGRMIGSWFWEEMREGVDDDSYLHTLEALIEQTADNEAPAVVEARDSAREVLSRIADHIDLDINPAGRGPLTYRPFAPEDFDGLRWKAALAAARLLAAVEGKDFAFRSTGAGARALLHRVRYEPDVETTSEATRPILEPFVVGVRELPKPITLDGKLDEPCYREQPQAASFIELTTSRPATPWTEVHLLADAETVYLGIHCHEPRVSELRMDEAQDNEYIWDDDVVEIFLDPKHTHRSYYHFGITPRGTRALLWHPHTRKQGTLGPQQPVEQIWEARVQHEERAWTLEIAIPLAAAEVEGPCFGMSVCRSAPQHGLFSCWTQLPQRSYHQPEANADVYLPGAPTVVERITLGHLTAGQNLASMWVREAEDAAPATVEMTAPGGAIQDLVTTRQAEVGGLARYDASYDLGEELGGYAFDVRAGATALGVYRGEYASAFFSASLRRGFIWSGEQRPAKADIELLVPPGAPLDGFSLRLRVLGETGPVKEATITGLQSRRITAFVNLDDLPLDVYDLEVALLDRDGKQLKRTLSEFEVLPAVL